MRGLRVSTDYLKVHGVRPLVGREFTTAEDVSPTGPDSALMSESLAIRLFTDPVSALGRSINLGGRPYTVVGVLPRDFVSMPSVDVLTPLRTTARDLGVNYRVLGRLRTEMTAEAAQAELETLRGRTCCGLFQTSPNAVLLVSPGRDTAILGQGVRQPVLLLFGAVAFLLLIACANVANLYIARAVARHREIATRASLGASRSRLVRHVLTESIVLAVAGAPSDSSSHRID